MDLVFFIKSVEAILEVVFLCLAIYCIMYGFKTGNYRNAKIYTAVYLLLNFIRSIAGF